jgi:hypothetical protein
MKTITSEAQKIRDRNWEDVSHNVNLPALRVFRLPLMRDVIIPTKVRVGTVVCSQLRSELLIKQFQ